jgi:WD40 repeat protein
MHRYIDYTNVGKVNYLKLINTERFKRINYLWGLKKGRRNISGEQQPATKETDNFFGSPKLLIESIIYVATLDVFIYTTVNPQTPTIVVSKIKDNKTQLEKLKAAQGASTTKSNVSQAQFAGHEGLLMSTNTKFGETGNLSCEDPNTWASILNPTLQGNSRQNKAGGFEDGQKKKDPMSFMSKFECKTLARLIGHECHCAPTIMYVAETGCLISADKFHRGSHDAEKSKPDSTELGQKEVFTKYYHNIVSDKRRKADILIWNLDKDLFKDTKVNPPWTLVPTKRIIQAHYDSIISLTYLSASQLLVSSSTDGCIKFWDPTQRPHFLMHPDSLQALKPGYYSKIAAQTTDDATKGFPEVRRIYTGDMTCYNVCSLSHRVVLQEKETSDSQQHTRYIIMENLVTLDLGAPQRIGNKMKAKGFVKTYSVERVKLEIPANKFNQPMPLHIINDIEGIAVSNQNEAKMGFKKFLPMNLEKIMSKIVVQNQQLSQVYRHFKFIT